MDRRLLRTALLGALAALLLLAILTTVPISGAAATQPDWTKVKAVPIITDLDAPSNFAFAPDGSIWYTEVFKGNVTRFEPKTGEKELQRHVNSVSKMDERGLTGLALDPDFAKNGVYYLTYTEPVATNESLGTNKLVKIEDGKETVLTTWSGFEEHNGGRILIVPDGTMFVSTGENQKRTPAQDNKSPLGKILHMTRDGKPVAGNLDGLVYSKGHRNVYGLAWDEEAKQLYATENSGWRRDEVNKIVPKGNYGYPECEGWGLNGVNTPCPTNKGYIFPMKSFYEDHTAAPTGATMWRGELYWASLREGSIHHIWNESGEWQDKIVYDAEDNLLDVRVSPDDQLYYAGYTGIFRLDFGEKGAAEPPAEPPVAPETPGTAQGFQPGAHTPPGPQIPGLGAALTIVAAVAAFVFLGRRR